MNVLFTSNIPAPYVIDYLNELSKYCNVTALFELKTALDRDDRWYSNNNNFKIVYLNSIRMNAESGFSFSIIKYLKLGYDRIIIANPTTLTGIVALLYCRWTGIHFIIQSEGGFQGSGKGIKEKFKKYIMENADYYLSGMGGDNDYFLKYGGTRDKIYWYPFSSMKKKDIDTLIINNTEKEKIRRELGLPMQFIILVVGRFLDCKGHDTILNVAARLPNIHFCFVGGEPTKEYIDIINDKNLKNVSFRGFMDQERLDKYYHAADLFALATRGDTWGLVINEAMARGLPVITTNKCIAGMHLIENDVNGYVVNVDDENELTEKIHILANNRKKIEEMKENNIKKIQIYSIENMARIIYSIISKY